MSNSRKALRNYAHARSGDKGSDANVAVIALTDSDYEYLKLNLTTDLVKEFFNEICADDVVRYELPNLRAFNFILKGALGAGGGSVSLRTDAQGKALGEALLHLEL